MGPQEKVQHYIKVLESHTQDDLDEIVSRLACDYIESEDAELLIAFVPMAFAHEVLSPLGVALPSDFLAQDFDTGVSARGRLTDEPVFVAAKAMANEMLANDLTRQMALEIADLSAEMSVARKLSSNGGSMRDVVLTEPVLTRVPVEYVKRKARGLRWKFWA